MFPHENVQRIRRLHAEGAVLADFVAATLAVGAIHQAICCSGTKRTVVVINDRFGRVAGRSIEVVGSGRLTLVVVEAVVALALDELAAVVAGEARLALAAPLVQLAATTCWLQLVAHSRALAAPAALVRTAVLGALLPSWPLGQLYHSALFGCGRRLEDNNL